MATLLNIDSELEAQRWDQVLGEKPFRFRTYWNRRSQSYAMDVQTVENQDIVMGMKIVKGYDLIKHYDIDGFEGRDPGLITLDTENEDRRIEKGELGERIQILFLPESEVE